MPEEADMPDSHSCTTILGVRISRIDMPRALDTIDRWIERREPNYVCIRDVHGIMLCQRDAELRRVHNQAGMVTPDGMPLVWVSRLQGHKDVERVCGPDLMLEVCRRSADRGYRHFLYGGTPEVMERLTATLHRRFPGLILAGTYCPPFRPLTREEEDAVVEQIRASRADIVWVGIGTGKQEKWMAALIGRLQVPVMIGVGAAFDYHAGIIPRAPLWMQRAGLEWSVRLVSDFRRLWKRYLLLAPKFVVLVTLETLGLRRRDAEAG